MKKGDYIVIGLIFSISIFLFYFGISEEITGDIVYASVQFSGEEVERIYLDDSMDGSKFIFENLGNHNTVQIDKHSLTMVEADCKDQACIHQGSIGKIGETIVCLPNQVLIEIKSDEEFSDIDHINY